jgi:PAS domain S-box-containing protein
LDGDYQNRPENVSLGESVGLRQKVKKNPVSGNSGKIRQDLPKNLNWFDLVGNISFDALAIHERGQILEANQDFLDMFGYTLQEARTTSAFDMFAPQSRQAAREKITATYEGAYEAYGKKKDGTIFPILIRAKETFFKNRHVRVVVLRDLTLQKQQEQDIAASQKRFKQLSEAAFEAIEIHDFKRVLEVNEPFLKLFGYSLDEVKEMSTLDFVAPESMQSVKDNITNRYEGSYRTFCIKKDGTIFPAEVQAKNATLDGKDVRIGAIRDLTQEQQNEQQLKAVFESSQDHIIVLDKNYTHLYINQAALESVNKTPEQAGIGKTIADALGDMPDVMNLWMNRIDEVFASGKPMRFEDAVPVDDRLVYSESVLSPIRYPGGDMFAVSLVYRDVTKLKTSQQRYKRLSQAAFEGICIHDKGRIVDANPQFEHMFGFPSGQAKGADCYDLMAPQSMDMVKGYIKSGFEGPYQSIALKTDGSEFPIEVRARQVEMDGKRFRMAVFRDMTEQKKLQQELVESEEKYRDLYKNAHACLARTRISDGTLIDCSRATAAMFGYESEEEYKNNFSVTTSYVNPSQREQLIELLKKEKQVQDFELQLKRKDGTPFWVSVAVEIFPEKDYMEGVMQDITIKKVLTKTEKTILDYLMQGKSNKEIAFETRRSRRTVEDHRASIMRKIGVNNIVDLTQKVLHLTKHHTKK